MLMVIPVTGNAEGTLMTGKCYKEFTWQLTQQTRAFCKSYKSGTAERLKTLRNEE